VSLGPESSHAAHSTVSWHVRTVDLSSFAGMKVGSIDPFQWTSAPAGNDGAFKLVSTRKRDRLVGSAALPKSRSLK